MGIYWGALTIFEQLSNSNNETTFTGSVDLLELWLLSGGDKKEGTLVCLGLSGRLRGSIIYFNLSRYSL